MPNGYCQLGGCSVLSRSWLFGPPGKSTGASSAASARTPTIARPTQRLSMPQRRSDRARFSSARSIASFSFSRAGRARVASAAIRA